MNRKDKPWLPVPDWKGTWKDDWRIMNQEVYLLNKKLEHRRFDRALCVEEHDQCDFCWALFDKDKENPSYAYYSPDEKVWVCEECYNDFKEHFNWIVEECEK